MMRLQICKCLYKICQWLTHAHKNNLYFVEAANLDSLLRFSKKDWMDICERKIIPTMKD